MSAWRTCHRCERDLYPRPARRSDDGWECGGDKQERAACGRRARFTRLAAERAEDLAWMAATGENLTGAAERLGLSVDALATWAREHDADALVERLRRNGWAA